MKHRKIYLSFVSALLLMLNLIALQPFVASAAPGPTPGGKVCTATGTCPDSGSTDAQKYCVDNGHGGTPCTDGYDGQVANKTKEQACKKYIGHTGTTDCYAGYDGAAQANTKADYGTKEWLDLCEKLSTLNDDSLYNANCSSDTTGSQSKMDAAVKNICDKYGTDKLKTQCDAYTSTQSNNGGGDSSTITDQCDLDANPLTWIICPVIDGLNKVISFLDNTINSLLSVGSPGNSTDATQIFCSDSSGSDDACVSYKQAWSSFRDIALGLLVIVALIVVISQALGMELLDAYTIRKVLPRMVLAAITITLSWQLMEFFVDMSNALGYGIRFLIEKPFTGANINTVVLSGGSQAIGTLLAVSSVVVFTLFGLLSFAVTGLIAVLIAYVVLVLRQIAIIILIIVAPVAIVASILPNTRNAYKLWWDSFAKALMMFPIIAGFIAAGRVFAAVADAGGAGPFGQVLGFAAYFAPYFLIPLTFRFAGGAIRGIGGFVNDRGRGGFDRLRNYRGQKVQQSMQAMKEGNRYRASNPLARGFNRTTRGVANIPAAGQTPWKMRSRYQAGLSEKKMSTMGEYMEKSTAFKAMSGNDDYLQATMESMGGGSKESDWRRYLSAQGYSGRSLEQGVASIRAAKRDTNDEVFAMAATVANASTGTGWKEGGVTSMMQDINAAAGGDRDSAGRMLAEMRTRATQSGRLDLGGAGFGTQIGALNNMYENQGDPTKYGEAVQKAENDIAESALFTKGPGALIGARGDAVKHLAPHMVKQIQGAHARVAAAPEGPEKDQATRQLAQQYAAIASIHDNMSHAAPENARILADDVLNASISESQGAPKITDQLDSYRRGTDPDFLQARKDFDARQYGAEQNREAFESAQNASGPPPPSPGGK